ncbi:MAG TPA: benzoate-CoA ligase family protein [Steroidobacteraceae bacterium]|nr:benzoate-CoA ligase family protein [Steroidobacteraceae bacterium]
MALLSSADHSFSPPVVTVPRVYNAAHDLLERNLRAGRGEKVAYIDDRSRCTYSELAARVGRCSGALTALGLQREHRALLCMHDSIDWPVAFLGCIQAGIVPIAVNTLLRTEDYDYMLRDSRAQALIVSSAVLPLFAPLIGKLATLEHVIVAGADSGGPLSFDRLVAEASPQFDPAATLAGDVCFWLYSSGSTGAPKGTLHAHGSLIQTAELYGKGVLGMREDDVVFSAAKLFFAYGLGNALTFPMSVGATTILMAERPTPAAVFAQLQRRQPTLFCGVPTLYAALLAQPNLPAKAAVRLRACVSAGEPLPRDIGERWRRHFEVDILDGIGSTEMLHIFLSNRPGQVRYGTTGQPVPGYELTIVDDKDCPVTAGEIGELKVSGPSRSLGYWNNPEKTRKAFQGPWTRSGDKYHVDADGYYVYAGRSDDMLKVSGMYVSPAEVESALISHDAVLEAAVVGKSDADGLVKPIAFVVLASGHTANDALAEELKRHVKSRLAPHKYPRWVEFLPELPKTATGKIQRFKLRDTASRGTGSRQS